MLLLNPRSPDLPLDQLSAGIVRDTIAFFEAKGKKRLKDDDRDRVWYRDFLDFQKEKRIFSTLLTPSAFGGPGARWDTYRNCAFNEVLGFYGLPYWYTWQVSILGLGPFWMSRNDAMKRRAAALLADGGVFGFGLSEKEHGADIYSTEMRLAANPSGGYFANGRKYYIGNGNEASLLSVFGKMADGDDWVFFAADTKHPNYELVQNVCTSQSYVAEFALKDYPVAEDAVLIRGKDAWDASLNTVNVGKYNLGWASIGICTHAFYEALRHASRRRLYGMHVTDFPHVKRMFTDAWARLVAMRLFALRASDYFRSATREDRRYLLYNPVVKMKVTTQGESVIDLLWDVIAAKGFEKETYFEMAARDIRALPKLEGTVHVNIALILKFLPNYFFAPAPYPDVPTRSDPADDLFLFDQGPASGLGKIRFHDFRKAYAAWDLPNVNHFEEQTAALMAFLAKKNVTDAQQKDLDFVLTLGELFTLVVYGQLILENAALLGVTPDVVDQIFDFMVRDFSRFAIELYGRAGTSPEQAGDCLRMLRKPDRDGDRAARIWAGEVLPLADAYEMSP
ncbi:MAG TPA: acyl-CoA dehydrogenase [Thermoanaerobaculia bacterium]|nr:acyl-CoA dehydrogenase [Thermoanaerobaculia bacterium]HQR66083.1 acyl-CoA dehydrogenase [Thermoanaerobaculia bacterium]